MSSVGENIPIILASIPRHEYRSLTTDVQPNQSNFVTYIHDRVIEGIPSAESRAHKVAKRTLQSCAALGGFLARLTVVKVILKYAGDNRAYGIVLVYGNTVSYGSLISWCLLKVVNSEMASISKEEKCLIESKLSSCQQGLLKTALVAIGMVAQVPSAYIAYIYNDKNVLFPIALLSIDSAYPIYSLFLTTEEILKHRRFSAFERKIYSLKQEVIQCIQHHCSVIIHSEETIGMTYLEELRNIGHLENLPKENVKNYFEFLLCSHFLPSSQPDSILISGGRFMAKGAGLLLACSQLYFVYTLGYSASRELTDDIALRYTAAGIITACNAYLGAKVLVNSCIKTYDYVVNVLRGREKKTVASILAPKLRTCLQLVGLATISLSYAGPLQVSEDYFEGNMRTYMKITSVLEIMIISTYAIRELVDDMIKYKLSKSGSPYAKRLIELDRQMQHLITLIERSPFVEFIKLLDVLPTNLLNLWLNKLQLTSEQLQEYVRSQTT